MSVVAVVPSAAHNAGMATRNLREACVDEALKIIEEAGVEQLSLREVARRLGVSHQAPYKHFASRDHILAEVVARTFDDFARFLDAYPKTGDPFADLGAMGQRYFAFAREHPLKYRLLFNTPLPPPNEHPEMMRNAQHAFSLLRDGIARLPARHGAADADLDAMFVWSTIHGLASLEQSCAMETLAVPPDAMAQVVPGILARIGRGLGKVSQ